MNTTLSDTQVKTRDLALRANGVCVGACVEKHLCNLTIIAYNCFKQCCAFLGSRIDVGTGIENRSNNVDAFTAHSEQ